MKTLVRDGVSLACTDAGDGTPAFVCIHGAMADRSHFAAQVEHFSPRRRVVAPDLRGHGQSDKPEQDYTIAGFSDDIAWLAAELGVADPVLVGHSMGGLVALDVAARHPDLPAAVIVLDSPVLPPAWFSEAVGPFAAALKTPAYADAIGQFLSNFAGFPDDETRRNQLIARLSASPQHVTASEVESYAAFDSGAAAAACKVPLLYVSSGPWFTEVDAFRERCPQLMTGQTVGTGHYHQMEAPAQINAMIERFLRVNGIA